MAGEFKYTQDPLKEPLFLFKLNWSFVFMRKKTNHLKKQPIFLIKQKFGDAQFLIYWLRLFIINWFEVCCLFGRGKWTPSFLNLVYSLPASQAGRYLLQSIQLNWCSQLVLASQCGLGTRRYVLAPVVCYHRGLHLSMVLFWLFTLNCVIQEQRRKKSYYFILTVL